MTNIRSASHGERDDGERRVDVTQNHDHYLRDTVRVATLDRRTGAFLVDPAGSDGASPPTPSLIASRSTGTREIAVCS